MDFDALFGAGTWHAFLWSGSPPLLSTNPFHGFDRRDHRDYEGDDEQMKEWRQFSGRSLGGLRARDAHYLRRHGDRVGERHSNVKEYI